MKNPQKMYAFVTNEVSTLKKVLIHSPDGGIGKVVPSKAQDWLYEDIVDLQKMRKEYDVFREILLAFLDPKTLKRHYSFLDTHKNRNHEKPDSGSYLRSDKVIEIQVLLSDILGISKVRREIVVAICAVEGCSYNVQKILLNEHEDYELISPEKLAKMLITGYLKAPSSTEKNPDYEQQIFPPIPNLIFTRDIGIVIHDYILLSKPAKIARLRESILVKYIAYYSLYEGKNGGVIEIEQDEDFYLTAGEDELKKNIVTLEGGDIMMISDGHLFMGCSERTSSNAVNKTIQTLFQKKTKNGENLVKKVSVIVIPNSRDTMHIDTIFTQVSRTKWVLYGPLGRMKYPKEASYRKFFHDELENIQENIEKLKIYQFCNGQALEDEPKKIDSLEELLISVSVDDFNKNEQEVQFIYSGNQEYPYDEREQWTDSCNVLALREGVVIGYDRNQKTTEAFKNAQVESIQAIELLNAIKENWKNDGNIQDILDMYIKGDTIILIPSAELSRARGGSHCMSMPLLRDMF